MCQISGFGLGADELIVRAILALFGRRGEELRIAKFNIQTN
jgi:hypothetical protein